MRAWLTGAGSIPRCSAPTAGTAGAMLHGTLARWKSGTGLKSNRTWSASLATAAGSGFFKEELRLSRAGPGTRSEHDPAEAERRPPRYNSAGQAPGG